MAESDAEVRADWESPRPDRLAPDHPRRAEILERHGAAMTANVPTYRDPSSGYSVFTAKFLASRRYCCASGCRHCPYT
ncbi:MAG: DUF5522 domain-containing protein [Actinomycetota bacterium]